MSGAESKGKTANKITFRVANKITFRVEFILTLF